MIGVRPHCRGRDTLRRRSVFAPVIALLTAALALPAARLAGDETPTGFRPANNSPRLGRNIRQTAKPAPEPESTRGAPVRRASGIDDGFRELEDIKEPLAAVMIEGNKTIPTDEIAGKLKTRAGRVPDLKLIKEDIRALHLTKWFFNIEVKVTGTREKPVLVFKVLERPILQKVEYKGNKKIKTKDLAGLTGLKAGGGFDVGTNKEAVRRIESHYREKGYIHVEVKLEKGASPDDREVVFDIHEGPKVHVDKISFSGNKFVSGPVLKTQVKTKTRLLWLFGGKYDPATIPEDVAALKQYYHSLGFFDVKIKHREGVSQDKARVNLEYEIDEGERYKVRNVEFVGNRVIPEDQLRANLKMLANEFFLERKLNADVDKITGQYGELGRLFARIDASPRFLEDPGMVDLVYSIDEDRPYRVGVIRVHINGEHPHTKQSEVLNRLPFAPGDLASREKIKLGETKLRNSQIFAGAIPGQANAPRIAVAPPEFNPDEKKLKLVRGQSDVEEPPPSSPLLDPAPPLGPQAGPLFSDEPPAYLPYDVYVDETQTGRLMFGVGVNSNAGLVGSVVLEENNFDLFRPPTSFQDVLDGTAFRGGGQQFRIEAVPGTQLSRYLISWRDPYFLDQNVSFGVSGFYYQRFFPNWDEQRMGGNLTLGQMFTPQLSGAIRLRLENVNISNPSVPTPQTIQQTVGDNFLSTIRFSLAHDTRDSSFLPGKGHFVEASYEQGIADFVYPRAELEARQYWTLRERPDGGNRHIFSAVGQVGWVDNGAPFFEKFFAGGFQSFRGFAFYGVTPRENGGIRIGGRWQALGSLEYMVPITADDTIQIVGFTDFGTVEDQVTFDEFRVSVGGGVRLTIPAMGPVPIAIDFGVPIVKQGFDNTQLVAFYVGVLR